MCVKKEPRECRETQRVCVEMTTATSILLHSSSWICRTATGQRPSHGTIGDGWNPRNHQLRGVVMETDRSNMPASARQQESFQTLKEKHGKNMMGFVVQSLLQQIRAEWLIANFEKTSPRWSPRHLAGGSRLWGFRILRHLGSNDAISVPLGSEEI